ncbi:MAG: serine/threonine protein kinase [Deltaproteobacteria bacterium]|nr:serine/threonine protein kinase [Deltaproteobacteria bacterium]
MRICPDCQHRTDERTCPVDGGRTVPLLAHDAGPHSIVGTVLAERYRIDGVLGGGGMGTVYRATQLSVDRPVALKLLRPEIARDLSAAARFQREARVIAGLTHPNTIDLIDFGRLDDDRLFLVMELVEGEPLTELIAREAPLPPARAAHMLRQILEPLAEAHAKGIVHRDLKPDNILVARVPGRRDFLKLLDFGIARVPETGEPSPLALTGEGIAIGSPPYMSPEQAQGLPAGPPSDVYAVGLMAWELLAGARPFEAATARGWLLAHISQQVPEPSVGGAPLPEPYRSLLIRCLDKEPARRFEDAAAVIAWLRQRGAITTGPVMAEAQPDAMATGQAPLPDTERRRRALEARTGGRGRAGSTWRWTLAAALVAAGLGVGWFIGARGRGGPDLERPGTLAEGGPSAREVIAEAVAGPAVRSSEAGGPTTDAAVAGEAAAGEGATAAERDPGPASTRAGLAVGRAVGVEGLHLPPRLLAAALTSEPAGARVLSEGVELGRTPLEVRWLAGEGPPTLVLEAPDHAPARIRLVPADATTPRHVALTPRPRQRKARAAPTYPRADGDAGYTRIR